MGTRSPTGPAPKAQRSWWRRRPTARFAWSPTTAASSGFAILNPYFPGPRLTRGLYLKELYVAGDARSMSVGEALIEAIRALAKKRGDTRVLWTTGEDNAGAQRFYDRLGMRREKKVYYVMDV